MNRSVQTMLLVVSAALSVAVRAAAQDNASPACGTDSATVQYVRDRLLHTVPGKGDSTTVRLAADAGACTRARVAFPVDRGNLDRPYVFTVTAAPRVRYAVVRNGPEYPREIIWQWVVCFFDQAWQRVGSCDALGGHHDRVASLPPSPR